MRSFADLTVHLQMGSWNAWLLIGLLAGWGAGFVMSGTGFGLTGDMLTGVLGALMGGCLFGTVVPGDAGFGGSVAIAFLGACLFISVARHVALKRARL